MLQNSEQNSMNSDLFKALLGLNELTESDFWSNFETALYAHEMATEERAQSLTTKSTFVTNRFIWYEGLVWLTLAKRRGFTQPSSAYKYCPAEALQKSPKVYDMYDWILIQDPEN